MEQFWEIYQAYEQSLSLKHERSRYEQETGCMALRTSAIAASNFGCEESGERGLLQKLSHALAFKELKARLSFGRHVQDETLHVHV